eukprot:530620-Pelagomonas_calceolata.AAC.1
MFNGSANHLVPDDKVCWVAWSNCKDIGKTKTDSYASCILGLTGGGLGEVKVILLYKVKSHAGIAGNECADQ